MKRIGRIRITLILALLFILSFGATVFAEQGGGKQDFENRTGYITEGSKDLYVSPDGSVYYTTSDKEHTSSITYRTEAIVISDYNNPSVGTVLQLNDMKLETVSVPRPDGTVILQEFRKIGTVAELTSLLGTTNLRMDCLMQTYQGDKADGILYTDASLLPMVAAQLGMPLSKLNTSEALTMVYGWADKSGILSHFDWKLELLDLGFSDEQIEAIEDMAEHEDEEDPDSPIIDSAERENVVTTCGPGGGGSSGGGSGSADHDETGGAEYKTGTESSGNLYCIFEGIPSGKNLNNYYTADTWRAGSYVYAINQARTFSWTVTYEYQKYVKVGERYVNGVKEDITELRTFYQPQAFTGVVASSFTKLEKPSVYASFRGTVSNKAFDSDKIYSGPDGSGNYAPTGHLTFKTPPELPYYEDGGWCPLGLDGDRFIPQHIIDDGKATYAAYRNDGVESQNDDWTFTIDGESHHMLDGGGISTKGFVIGNKIWNPDSTEMPEKLSHEMLPNSASVLFHYAKGENYLSQINPHDSNIDSKMNFLIPANTDNGRYNTKVSLDFSLVGSASAGDNWPHSFSTETPYSEHTLDSYNPGVQCKSGGCGRDTSYDSFYPVEVHTPIHSPVQILNYAWIKRGMIIG